MRKMLATCALILSTPAVAADDPILAVRSYYAAISRGDFRAAYSAWDQDGRASHQGYDAFVGGFAMTSSARVSAGAPFDLEGAAGSAYVTVPVEVDATLKDGAHQHFTGSYTLRANNDVSAASPGAGEWHLFSAHLQLVKPPFLRRR